MSLEDTQCRASAAAKSLSPSHPPYDSLMNISEGMGGERMTERRSKLLTLKRGRAFNFVRRIIWLQEQKAPPCGAAPALAGQGRAPRWFRLDDAWRGESRTPPVLLRDKGGINVSEQ